MTRYGRLVWLFIALLFATNVACAPVVYVQPTGTMSFQQLLQADATIDARIAAHAMRGAVCGDAPPQSVDALKPMRLPEAYTLDGSEGTRASQYHLGYAAASLIREYYAEAFPNALRINSDKLVDIVDAADGNTYTTYEPNRDWPIEIADIQHRVVFEVVPPGETHRAYGKKKADFHLMFLNQAMIGVPPFELGKEFSGEIGVRFAEGVAPWRLSWSTTEPGVVQYQWEAMTVAKVTEDSCRDGYLDKLWHDVTPREMTSFARSLHEVVERLVQAREKLGPTRAAIKMPMVPGKTLFDYLQTVASWSAHDSQRAQLLPVMYGPPVQVVPAKQFVGDTVDDGGDESQAEGVYDLKGQPGKQPWNLHMGNSAHILIGDWYKRRHGQKKVFTNWVSISKIVEAANGKELLLQRNEVALRPDIADVNNKVVFEIKSRARGRLAEGQVTVAKYLAALNKAMTPGEEFKAGSDFRGNFWVRFNKVMPWWRIEWATTSPGVIQYQFTKLNNEETDEPTIMKGVEAGKYAWVDLTQGDMEQYGQECENFAKKYTGGADKLYKMQSASSLIVEAIGHAAIVYVGSGLSAKSNTTPQSAAQSTQSRPRVRVGAEPTPKVRVSPGSAPEPIAEPEGFPDVAARSKM